MKCFQQLDGTEIFIIHKVDNKIMVGGTNEVFYPFAPQESMVIIEDRYPLTEETLSILIKEIKEFLKNEKEED